MNMEGNPTTNNAKMKSKVEIVRLAPRNQGVDVQFRAEGIEVVCSRVTIRNLETEELVAEKSMVGYDNTFSIDRLLNDIDYVVEVTIYDYDGKEVAKSPQRLLRTGFFPGQVINYNHPEDLTYCDSGRFMGSPCIVKLNNGTYLASHDIFCGGHGALCFIFVSKDYGKTWKYLSRIERCTWGHMFQRGDRIYMLGTSQEHESDTVLYYSDNDGVSWSEPIVLFKHTKDYELRTSPTAFAEYNGRLWFSICSNHVTGGGFQTSVISVDASSDFTNKKNWAATPFLKFQASWEGTVGEPWGPCIMEEGNVIVDRNGELTVMVRYNATRYDIPECDPAKIKALMFRVDAENPTAELTFKKAIFFNGTTSKFYLRYDEESDLYYAIANRMTTNKIWQRNILTLFSSPDLDTWRVERDLLNLTDLGWQETDWYSGVQYPTWMIEGDDALAVVRTAMNGANTFHDSNAITFHRFKDFKDRYKF